jgi:hypothetical protein
MGNSSSGDGSPTQLACDTLMKDDTIHTQDAQTHIETNAYLTLSHRAIASFIVQILRRHPAVSAVGSPSIEISAEHAWQGIQLAQITEVTLLVSLAPGCDVTHECSQIRTDVSLQLGRWLEQPVTIDVYVIALAPSA